MIEPQNVMLSKRRQIYKTILYNSMYMRFLNKTKVKIQKVNPCLPGVEYWSRD